MLNVCVIYVALMKKSLGKRNTKSHISQKVSKLIPKIVGQFLSKNVQCVIKANFQNYCWVFLITSASVHLCYIWPHKKKSHELRSGDRGGHRTGPFHPIQFPGNFWLNHFCSVMGGGSIMIIPHVSCCQWYILHRAFPCAIKKKKFDLLVARVIHRDLSTRSQPYQPIPL